MCVDMSEDVETRVDINVSVGVGVGVGTYVGGAESVLGERQWNELHFT